MNIACCHIARLSLAVITPIAFTACGGGSPPTHLGGTASGGTGSGGTVTGPNTTYRVGGTVSGLIGQGLTIELLNPATLARHATILEQIDIAANGVFVFRIPPSQGYGVAIVHQPRSPTQQCVVWNGQGVIGRSNVTDVSIVCGKFAFVARPLMSPNSALGIEANSGTQYTGTLLEQFSRRKRVV